MLAGDSLGELVVSATRAQGITPDASSALIVAQKVVSKAEGRRVKLTDVDVTAEAQALADVTGKDPRLVSLILSESRSIIRTRRGSSLRSITLAIFWPTQASTDQMSVMRVGRWRDCAPLA